MEIWLQTKEETDQMNETFGSTMKAPRGGFPACGTVGCIGGWIEVLYKLDHPRSDLIAREILGLDRIENSRWWWTEDSLANEDDLATQFFMDHKLVHAKGQQTKKHAEAVAAHIERFIKKWQ